MNDESNFHVNNIYGISSRRVKSVGEIVSLMLLAAAAMFAPKMSLARCYEVNYTGSYTGQGTSGTHPAGTTYLIRPYYSSINTYMSSLTLTTGGGAVYSMSWGCTDGKFVYLSPFFYTTKSYQETRSITAVTTWGAAGQFYLQAISYTPKNFGATPMACSANTCAGNPINTATGNKYQVETDFIGAPDTHIELSRTYNSLDARTASLGVSWRHTYERSVFSSPGSSLAQLYRPDGRVEEFWSQSGIWAADPDVTNTLAPIIIGGMQTGWKVTTSDDSTEYYNMAGQLTSIVTRSGLTTTLAYNANNQLATVTGPSAMF